jgi:hypothetical protein
METISSAFFSYALTCSTRFYRSRRAMANYYFLCRHYTYSNSWDVAFFFISYIIL